MDYAEHFHRNKKISVRIINFLNLLPVQTWLGNEDNHRASFPNERFVCAEPEIETLGKIQIIAIKNGNCFLYKQGQFNRYL
jgi:hypothetical protein